MSLLLYRGVNREMHEKSLGKLIPKEFKAFSKSPLFGRAEFGNSFLGENCKNAVVEHQQHQKGYPTSGISTTPIFERAVYYAKYAGKYSEGAVYVIDQNICELNKISIFNVNEIVNSPSVPEDEEKILVANDYGVLVSEIIIDIIKC